MSEKELEKFFSAARKKIHPSKELGQRILANLDVTEKEENRYILRERDKGRFSSYELILNQIHIFMAKWKVVVPVALVILVVAGAMIIKLGQETPPTGEPQSNQEQAQETEYVQIPRAVSIPKVNGTVDNLIDAMTAFSENEQVITAEEGNDVSMVNIDSRAISDFGQSYDENQF